MLELPRLGNAGMIDNYNFILILQVDHSGWVDSHLGFSQLLANLAGWWEIPHPSQFNQLTKLNGHLVVPFVVESDIIL